MVQFYVISLVALKTMPPGPLHPRQTGTASAGNNLEDAFVSADACNDMGGAPCAFEEHKLPEGRAVCGEQGLTQEKKAGTSTTRRSTRALKRSAQKVSKPDVPLPKAH